MPFIYKIVNKINGKCYIGKTLSNIQTRWKQHVSNRNREYYKNRPLYRAFNKYGLECFEIVQLEECEYSIIDDREKYWILKYNTFGKGYNATLGGDGRPFINEELIVNLWKDGKTINEIHELTHYAKDSLKKILDLFNITKQERILRSRNTYVCKPVLMLDKKTEKVIKEFKSTTEANKFLNIKGRGHISAVCNGTRKSCYGYKWKWK